MHQHLLETLQAIFILLRNNKAYLLLSLHGCMLLYDYLLFIPENFSDKIGFALFLVVFLVVVERCSK